jgi:ABC-type branched-subunit amino acid transport system permease subunit
MTLVSVHQVIFGILFIAVVLVLPGGLVDLWSRLRRRQA